MTHDIKTPRNLIAEATEACSKLISLLEEENTCLAENHIELIDEIAQAKDTMSQKLHALLADIKAVRSQIDDEDPELATLKKAIMAVEEPAKRNVTLLEAKHMATRSFLDSVRRAVSKPKPQTYGSNGKMASDEADGKLIHKSI